MTHEKKARLLAALGARLVRLWIFTLRFRLVDRAGVLNTPPEKPLLWAFWHNRLFVMAPMFEKFFPGRPGAALASASKDGAIIAAVMEQFGIRAIRGSSSRGGATGLRNMAEAYTRGHRTAITADGPRGPAMVAKPGPIQLAALTGATWIGAFHALPDRAWQLNSWDRFLIPKPFSTVTFTWPPHAAPTQTAVQSALDEAVAMSS